MEFFQVDNVTKSLGILITSLIVCRMIYKWIRTRNYPPGPIGLPLLGYGFFLGENPHYVLEKLGKKYGGIFSFYTGPQLIVCSTDYHFIKDILNLPNTITRPPRAFDFLVAKAGIGTMEGEEWREQRRFTMHTLRNLGLGRGHWETLVQENATDFILHELKKQNGKPLFFEPLLSRSQITNNLYLLFGRDLDSETEEEYFRLMYEFSKDMLKQMSATNINVILPSMFKLLKLINFRGIRDFMDLSKTISDFFEKEIEKRMKLKNDKSSDDYLGCYLKEMEKAKNDVNSTYTVENLVGNMFIILIGAHDSTVSSIGWLLLLMAKHQDIQKKICEEIDRAIGRDGAVYYEDKLKLPYTLASILEMLRWVSISGIYPPRCVNETFTYQNYEIPKGAIILSNAYAMMHDPKYFKNPMVYEPENFLNEDGTVRLSNVDSFGPFSFGRRMCPGDGIAVMTMYLVFVIIMQKFRITPPPGKVPDMSYVFTAALLPVRQELCFIER